MTSLLTTFDDSRLIEMALSGQAECFATLMDRHLAVVRRRIVSMAGSAADADDLLQEVLLKVWRHLSTFRSECSFRTWITRVAINEALQLYRKEQRRPICHEFDDLDTLPSHRESPYHSMARIEITQTVRSAVAELPEKYSRVLILRDLEQFSGRETAELLQTSVAAVKTRLSRARLMLLAALRRSRIPALASGDPWRPVGVSQA